MKKRVCIPMKMKTKTFFFFVAVVVVPFFTILVFCCVLPSFKQCNVGNVLRCQEVVTQVFSFLLNIFDDIQSRFYDGVRDT